MFSSTLLPATLLSLPLCIQALTSPHPAPTDKAADALGLLNGISPKPTASPPAPHLGYIDSDNLFGRAASQQPLYTCGYTDADYSSPYVCGTSSACSFGDGPDFYFGCCQWTGSVVGGSWTGTYGSDCFTVGTCVEYASHSFSNAGASLSGDAVLCGSSSPDCATTYVNSVADYGGPYTHYDCVSSAYSGDVVNLSWYYYTGTASTSSVAQGRTPTATLRPQSIPLQVVGPASESSATSSSASSATTSTTSGGSAVSVSSSATTTNGAVATGAGVPLAVGGLAVVAGVMAGF